MVNLLLRLWNLLASQSFGLVINSKVTVIIAIIVNLRVGRSIISNQILKLSSFPKLGHHTLPCFHFSSSVANSVEVNCQDQCNFLQKNELYWLWHEDPKTSAAKIKLKKLEEKCHTNI